MKAKSVLTKVFSTFMAIVMVVTLQVPLAHYAYADEVATGDSGPQVLTLNPQKGQGQDVQGLGEQSGSTDPDDQNDPVNQNKQSDESFMAAEDAPDVIVDEMELAGDEVYATDSLPDVNEMLEGYIEVVTSDIIESSTIISHEALSNQETSLTRNTRGAKLTGVNKLAYDYLKKQIELVATGVESSTDFNVPFSVLYPNTHNKRFSADELNVSGPLYENGTINEAAVNALRAQFPEPNYGVIISALLYDCPFALFWHDKTRGVSTGPRFGYGLESVSGSEYDRIFCPPQCAAVFSFAVSTEYAGAYQGEGEGWGWAPLATNADRISSIEDALEKAAGIVEGLDGKSDYEKLEAYKKAICEAVSYDDYAADDTNNVSYGDPWQLIYVFDNYENTNVVCEGYSKAFKYLCDLTQFQDSNIEAHIMTGMMLGGKGEGGHMWNEVYMDDKQYYLVDLTNCDEYTIGYPDRLFLVGNEDGPSSHNIQLYDENGNPTGQYPSQKYVFPELTSSEGFPLTYVYDIDAMETYSDTERLLATSDYTPVATEATYSAYFSDDLHVNEGAKDWALYYVQGSTATVTPGITVKRDDEVLPDTAYTIAYERSLGFNDDDQEIFEPATAPFAPGSYCAWVQLTGEGAPVDPLGPLWFNVQDAYNLDSQFVDIYLTEGADYQYNLNPMNSDYFVIPISEIDTVLNSLEVRTGGEHSQENPHDGTLIAPENYSVTYFPAKVEAAYGEIEGSPIAGAALEGIPTARGAYVMVVEGKDPYYGTHEILLDVQDEVANATIAPIADQFYTGEVINPELVVTFGGQTLTKDVDYTVSIENNIEPGEATVTIADAYPIKDNKDGQIQVLDEGRFFAGTKTATFTILSPLPAPTDLAWKANPDGTSYATWKGSEGAEQYHVTLKRNGAWYGTMTVNASQNPDVAGTIYDSPEVAQFFSNIMSNGGGATYTFEVVGLKGQSPDEVYSEVATSEPLDYKLITTVDMGNVWTKLDPVNVVPFTAEIHPGEYDEDGVLFTDKLEIAAEYWTNTAQYTDDISSYKPKKPKVNTSYRYSVTIHAINGWAFKNPETIGKNAWNPTFDLIVGGGEKTFDTWSTVAYGYDFKSVSFGPFDMDTGGGVVTVKPVDISKATVTGVADKTYTGKAISQTPTVKLKVNGTNVTLKNGTDYTLSYKNNVNMGTATVTITGKDNYKGSVSKTFKITKKVTWKRLAGSTAFDTMEQITKEYGKASVAIVTTNALAATGVDAGYKDALAGAALAGGFNAPMLTTSKGGLADKTRSELKRMGVKTVYIIGSTNEVATKVDTQIKAMGITVKRINAKTASERAIAAAKQVKGRSDTVIIATQNNFKDALAISSYAYASKSPILYAETNKKLSSATVNYIKSGKFKKAIIVGGPVPLPTSIEGQLKSAGIAAGSISRLAGSNQYKTARVVAEWAMGKLKNGTGGGTGLYQYASIKFQPAVKLSANKLGVARADDNNIGWKDALAGAALCGKNKSVMLLADAANDGQAEAFVKANKAQISMGYIFGGTSAVPAATETKLEKASM